ncbi:carbohydrate-binding protein [Streptomyces sp. NPDC001514]
MTAGNSGASTPEDEDPFGYLYADGQQSGATTPRQGGYGYPGPAAAQPGVPRTSYNQVRTVGERQYGQVPQQQAYGQQQAQQQYAHQPSPQYAAPETYPGGAPTRQVPTAGHGHGGGRGRGPNTKGLLIGAVAVVAVVVIGIAAALATSGDDDKDPQASRSTAPADQVKPSDDPSKGSGEDKPAELPKQDAATLQLGPPAALAKDVKGAEGADGAYVTFNAVGSSVTWKATIEEAGTYRLYVRYAIPATDANATLTVNGKPNTNPIGLKNFIGSSDPNLEKNWQTTWAPVNLKQGENELKLSCEPGNQCNAILDWLEVKRA